ncbi:hypothetical protein, partial [Cetobacterium sp.]|uniref:hypothetical protein n=1 Tax=Cetobacterium sp. TaxID=2071632 RepID=UPI003EE660E1
NADEEVRIKRCIAAGDKFDLKSFNDYTETALDDFKFDIELYNNINNIEELARQISKNIFNVK